MKKHVKIYLDYFGLSEFDFIPSEVSGKPANQIHHIQFGSKKFDAIENLIAITMKEHEQAHNRRKPELTEEELQEIHNKNLK